MTLAAQKQQLLARMKSLKQQEQVLESLMSSSEREQQDEMNEFKNEIQKALDGLSVIPSTFAGASKQVESVYSLSNDLSWRIREVDTAISRCSQTAAHVRHFADLTECLGSIDGYIERKEVEKTCDYVRRLLEVPQSLLSQENTAKIESSRSAALSLLREQLESENGDPSVICGKFVDCGAQGEGISQFVDLQYRAIIEESRSTVVALSQLSKGLSGADATSPHIEAFVKLLNVIGQKIIAGSSTWRQPDQFAVFVRLVLERCDGRVADIIKRFGAYPSVESLERKCSMSSADLDLPAIHSVNEGIVVFARQWGKFESFAKGKMRDGVATPFFQEFRFESPNDATTGFPLQSEASRELQCILMSYATLAQAYVRQIANEMLQLVKAMRETEEVTDAIVDLFFVFRGTLDRSIETRSVAITCTIFNVITEICRRDLMQAVGIADDSLASRIWTKTSDVMGKGCILINACRMSEMHLTELMARIEGTVLKQFADDSLTAIQSGLADLKSCGNELEVVLREQMDKIVTSLTVPCQNLCMPLRSVQWRGVITSEREVSMQMDVKSLWAECFDEYARRLNDLNYKALMERMADIFCSALTSVISQKTFDQAGASLFHRMITFMSDLFRNKDRFRPLFDIARILELRSPDDIPTIWGTRCMADDPVKLSIKELKALIRMRADWNTADLSFLLGE